LGVFPIKEWYTSEYELYTKYATFLWVTSCNLHSGDNIIAMIKTLK